MFLWRKTLFFHQHYEENNIKFNFGLSLLILIYFLSSFSKKQIFVANVHSVLLPNPTSSRVFFEMFVANGIGSNSNDMFFVAPNPKKNQNYSSPSELFGFIFTREAVQNLPNLGSKQLSSYKKHQVIKHGYNLSVYFVEGDVSNLLRQWNVNPVEIIHYTG